MNRNPITLLTAQIPPISPPTNTELIRGISLSNKEINIILNVIKDITPEYSVWLFGSRYWGTNKKFSDVDLAFIGNERLTIEKRAKLLDAFSESDLPYFVDIVDYNSVSQEFRDIIDKGSSELRISNSELRIQNT